MALVNLNFESQYLMVNHEVSVILPDKPLSLIHISPLDPISPANAEILRSALRLRSE